MSPAPEEDYSFPSGHAMGTMADVCARYTHLVDALALAHPHPAGLFVLAVGLSRTWACTSDIMAGWSASLAWVTGVYQTLSSQFLQSWLSQRRVQIISAAYLPPPPLAS